MIQDTISASQARRFYDWLGAGHDLAEFFESQAKQRGLARLSPSAGLRILNAGVGTGKEHRQIQAAVGPDGIAVGLDLAPVMLRLSQQRTGAPLCQADIRRLPLAPASFDALFASYVLDLLPAQDLLPLLLACRRLLKPGGRLVLVSLTEGVDWPSRALVGLWQRIYGLNPMLCGGCRPLKLAGLARQAGFSAVEREVVLQLGLPSEIIEAVA